MGHPIHRSGKVTRVANFSQLAFFSLQTSPCPKVFLGGLPSSITETDLRSFFTRYGEVVEVVIMYDQEKKKSRGFGFLSFAEESACARAVADHFVNVQNKQVDIWAEISNFQSSES